MNIIFRIAGVLLLLGIVFMIVGPRISPSPFAHEPKISSTKVHMSTIETALDTFKLYAGRYPSSEEGLAALIRKPELLSDEQWKGPYLSRTKVLIDGWKRPFIYRYPSEHNEHIDLISLGPDGKLGTEDDMVNWGDHHW